MFFPALITVCMLIGGWSFLSVLGNERQREVQKRDQELAAQAAEAAAAAAKAEASVAREVAR
jgi:hypothetical protein